MELILRKLLWFNHGCPRLALSGDDGEMQCGLCGIDFKRDSQEEIEKKMVARGRKIVEVQVTKKPSSSVTASKTRALDCRGVDVEKSDTGKADSR